MKVLSIIVCLLIAINGTTQVITAKAESNDSITNFKQARTFQKPIFHTPFSDSLISNSPNSMMFTERKSSIPLVEYNTTIFCKFEHQLMMSSKLPLKMRLGDVQYVDHLEGKRK